ncbi:MAG: toll/interleukin-1 receptor domain-containing protein [Rhodomicrobium sp.]|nr:toll/interleukin-1 receptor domain-containing protein [Rhodomicrobium sp.]
MRIFLSYASENKGAAEPIAFSLRNRGHHVFFDRDDLPDGDSYDDRIQTAIDQSDLFIFLITPDAVAQGRFTMTELKFARHRWRDPGGRVLPVVLTPTPMADIPSYLKAVTLLEPHGNVAAEVAFAAERLRGNETAINTASKWGLAGIAAAALASLMPVINTDASFAPMFGVAFEAGIIFAALFCAIYFRLGETDWRKLGLIAMAVCIGWFLAVKTHTNLGVGIFESNLTSNDIDAIVDKLSEEEKTQVAEQIRKLQKFSQDNMSTTESMNALFVGGLASAVGIAALMIGLAISNLSFRYTRRFILAVFTAQITGAVGMYVCQKYLQYAGSNAEAKFEYFGKIDNTDLGFFFIYLPVMVCIASLLAYWLVRGQET